MISWGDGKELHERLECLSWLQKREMCGLKASGLTEGDCEFTWNVHGRQASS
jgi:hypothetical protein